MSVSRSSGTKRRPLTAKPAWAFPQRCREKVLMICLDAKCKVLCLKTICEGSVNSASVDIRRIVELALYAKATSVILAHNHTSGIALPSGDDEITTRGVATALKAVGITLSDHIIVADGDFVSMAQNGSI